MSTAELRVPTAPSETVCEWCRAAPVGDQIKVTPAKKGRDGRVVEPATIVSVCEGCGERLHARIEDREEAAFIDREQRGLNRRKKQPDPAGRIKALRARAESGGPQVKAAAERWIERLEPRRA